MIMSPLRPLSIFVAFFLTSLQARIVWRAESRELQGSSFLYLQNLSLIFLFFLFFQLDAILCDSVAQYFFNIFFVVLRIKKLLSFYLFVGFACCSKRTWCSERNPSRWRVGQQGRKSIEFQDRKKVFWSSELWGSFISCSNNFSNSRTGIVNAIRIMKITLPFELSSPSRKAANEILSPDQERKFSPLESHHRLIHFT